MPWPDLARFLTTHTVKHTKDGPGWSPATYKRDQRGNPLTRGNVNVDALTAAVADVDHASFDDIAELQAHIKELGLAGLLYSTYSHTTVEPRVRVVIPFVEPVPADLWPRLWPALNASLFLGLCDTAASDASRMYYLPTTPGDETTIADSWDGAPFDWHDLPLADPAAVTPGVAAITARASGLTGPIATPSPEAYGLIADTMAGKHGGQVAAVWVRTDPDAASVSEEDWALAKEIAYHAIRRGHEGDDLHRVVEEAMRAGPWRRKWDHPRGPTTWLATTVAKAIATKLQQLAARPVPAPAADPWDDDPPDDEPWPWDDDPATGGEHTCAAVERLRWVQAALAEERRGRARDRRFMAAERTLRRSPLSDVQVDACIETTRLAARRASYFGHDEVIVTGEEVATLLGVPPKAITTAQQLVFAIPGSPLARETKPRENGRPITRYTGARRDLLDLLEQLAASATTLTARPTIAARRAVRPAPRRRPPPPIPSPCCPGERLIALEHRGCTGCGRVHEMAPVPLYVISHPIAVPPPPAPLTVDVIRPDLTYSGALVMADDEPPIPPIGDEDARPHPGQPGTRQEDRPAGGEPPTPSAVPPAVCAADAAGGGIAPDPSDLSLVNVMGRGMQESLSETPPADTTRRLPLVERRDVWICPAGGCGSMERHVFPDGSWRCLSRGHRSQDYAAPPSALVCRAGRSS